jgi:hypothetical protein
MKIGLALLSLAVLTSCSPSEPTPPPPAPANVVNVTIPGNPTCVVVNGNGCNTAAPSPSPGGAFVKPDYVKITQFGETCPSTVLAGPSGQDRSVRIGCTKALTLSPKCRQPNGPDIDCPVPNDARPDEFKVLSGGDHIIFAAFGSASFKLLSIDVHAFTGVHMESDAFNRLATGTTEGQVVITGSYAGVRALEDFTLTVIK